MMSMEKKTAYAVRQCG